MSDETPKPSCPFKGDQKSLPARMKRLRVDENGYVVPWFVDYVNGKPDHRVMSGEKYVRAIKDRRCWVCGDVLGVNVAFVAGPMCGINRTSAEPPSHYDCARWSALNCPFLSNPERVRRQDEISNQSKLADGPGFAIARNPGVTMVWVTKEFERFPDGKGSMLFGMGEPERVEWYARGRVATRGEVDESIATGLPNLEAMARLQEGAMAFLAKSIERFQRYLPAEPVMEIAG